MTIFQGTAHKKITGGKLKSLRSKRRHELGVVDSGKIFSIIIFGSTIGDPLATIVGSGIHSFPLPFNRRKSVAGFLAMLLPTCIVGYILAGYVGLAVAVTGTFAESISIHTLDDNFTVPASMGIISRLIQAIL